MDERGKLLEAHYAGAVPVDLMKTEQDRITRELNSIEQRLAATEMMFESVEQCLKKAYALIGNLRAAYLEATPRTRRLMNQALFERILVDDEDVVGDFAKPFDLLMEAAGREATQTVSRNDPKTTRGPESGPRGLNDVQMVELSGLEPLTSWVRSRRSPS